MIAIGAGGLEVACALAGHPFALPAPRIVGVRLEGHLRPWVQAKDVILELLRRRKRARRSGQAGASRRLDDKTYRRTARAYRLAWPLD